MQYHYTALRPDNRIVEGEADGENTAEVLRLLSEKSLRPISVVPIKSLFGGGRSFLKGRINLTDQVFLTKYLALMLRVGTDLLSAVDILIADFDKPAVKVLLIELRNSISKGQPFHATFANYPKTFSPVFVNMIRAGEASGNLEKVFDELSTALDRQQNLASKIKSAMIYPVVLMSVSLVILIILVSFALPKIAGIFSGSSFKPPLFSRVVFAIGGFFGDNIFLIFGGGALLIIAAALTLYKSSKARSLLSRFLLGLPVIKDLASKIAIQRFAATLSSLMKSGLSIIDALEITAATAGNEDIKKALMRVSREGISKGLTIGEAFKKEPAFPKIVSNLIAISEKSGHVDEILNTLSVFYENETDLALKALVSLLEPMLLMVIGLIIAVIALAIIVPIYQLVGQF